MKKRLFCILIGTSLLAACDSSANNTLIISHTANGSMGENWKYEMSTDEVLRESDHKSASQFPVFGAKHTWTFEAIGAGEVTLYWTAYESGNEIVEDECYSVTYIVDNNLNITSESKSSYYPQNDGNYEIDKEKD